MAARNKHNLLMTAVAMLVSVQSWALCTPLCLTGDFDSQLRHILHEQMLSTKDPIISRALDDVRATLNQRWQGHEFILCGSLATGLGVITSDIDLFVKIPNFNVSAGLYVLQETVKLFKNRPELYTRVRYKSKTNFKLLSFIHIPSQRIVDMELDAGEYGFASSKIVRYFFELDKRFLPLGRFLKYFFKKHAIVGHGSGPLSGYGLYMLIIFYLQQRSMAPAGFELQVNSKIQFIDNWDMSFNELPYRTTNTENLYQLLGGFFKYYSEFNFEEYIVSPFLGHPIPRTAFTNMDNFPKTFAFKFNNTLQHKIRLRIQNNLNTSTDLCIQDIYTHDFNTEQFMSHEQAMKFKYLLKSVAAMFQDVPSERILGAILVTDQQGESVISCNYASVKNENVTILP